MAKLREATKFDAIKHKYKKTSIGKRKIKTSSINKHKRRAMKKAISKKQQYEAVTSEKNYKKRAKRT